MAEEPSDAAKAVEQLYHEMYRCMIAKDISALDQALDASFVLVHMTGMRQTKEEYLRAIADGTLNYYSCTDTRVEISIQGDRATLIGCSRVEAAVFGGRRHIWPLRLTLTLVKRGGKWRIERIQASTY